MPMNQPAWRMSEATERSGSTKPLESPFSGRAGLTVGDRGLWDAPRSPRGAPEWA